MADPKATDDSTEQLVTLAEEARAAHASFKRRFDAGELNTVEALGGQMLDLFSLAADFTQTAADIQNDHLEWAEGIEDTIEDLEQGPGGLSPDDAEKLKSTILALQSQLKTPGDSDYDADAISILKTRVQSTLAWIDEITDDEVDEEDEDDETPESGVTSN